MFGKSICAGFLLMTGIAAFGCGDDDDGPGGSQAQRLGVGAACSSDANCAATAPKCLSFKGGYCGLQDCVDDAGCPAGSACVAHDDGQNYCFLVCNNKSDCNIHRPLEFESNCSANVTFVSPVNNRKACVPPS